MLKICERVLLGNALQGHEYIILFCTMPSRRKVSVETMMGNVVMP